MRKGNRFRPIHMTTAQQQHLCLEIEQLVRAPSTTPCYPLYLGFLLQTNMKTISKTFTFKHHFYQNNRICSRSERSEFDFVEICGEESK